MCEIKEATHKNHSVCFKIRSDMFTKKRRREASLDEARTSGLGHSMSGLHRTQQAYATN